MRTLLCAALAAAAVPALAETRLATYEVTLTNATRNQRFTPVLVATHGEGARLFSVGMPASPELATLAEEGDTAPLASALQATSGVREVSSTSGLLAPGASVQVVIRGVPGEQLSVAAMLIPTNDAFVAVNGTTLPKNRVPVTLNAVAYDAGSERNDESCASIPGPGFAECGGPGGGGAPSGGEEGFVHVHNGMHGVGDFDDAERDWRNPVARVSIRRIQ
ncbi:MAG: spondin domain-containing protein [Deltaproteobacteria bacterium]|nr:spondin domain-containing protein [Deltaproteobacteria bacterium]